jgi:hypothetical protein
VIEPTQIVFGAVIVAILVGMASFFAWRQIHALRSLPGTVDISPDDRRYVVHQAWRRLTCSILMVVLAVLIASSFFLEGPANVLVEQGQAAKQQGIAPQLDPAQRQFLDLYRNFWLIVLLILFAIIMLAAWDYFAIRLYGQRHYRQIQDDRRAMIENELARLRSQRNGHSGVKPGRQ